MKRAFLECSGGTASGNMKIKFRGWGFRPLGPALLVIAALSLAHLVLMVPVWAAPVLVADDGANPNVNSDVITIMSGAKTRVGTLGIGVGYVGIRSYRDDKGARRNDLHASLTIIVEDKPAQFQQPDVHEGDTLAISGYRISIVTLNPDPKGSVVMRVDTTN
jgi:hypothetical protein